MNLHDFFGAQESVTKMVGRLDIKFQNVDTDGIEPPSQMFIKVLTKRIKIVHQIFTLKFPVPFFSYQSLINQINKCSSTLSALNLKQQVYWFAFKSKKDE